MRRSVGVRLLVAATVWVAIVGTTAVCARFAMRLAEASALDASRARSFAASQQQVAAWRSAPARTAEGFLASYRPQTDRDEPGGEPRQSALWIWEVQGPLDSLSTRQLGDGQVGRLVHHEGQNPVVASGNGDVDLFGEGRNVLPDTAQVAWLPSVVESLDRPQLASSVLPLGGHRHLVVAEGVDVSQEQWRFGYQRRELVRVGILLGVVGALGSWLLAGVVSRPLEQVASSISGFATDQSVRARVTGPAEVAQLADAFNTMADRMEHTLEVQRRFVADTSHELRTPAAALLAGAQAVDLSVPHDELLDLVLPQAARLAGLTEDLLDLNRFDEGRQRLDARPVDLGALVREAVAQLGAACDVRITDTTPGPVSLDPTRVVRIVRNLVSNALEHGAAPVHVVLGADGPTAMVSVTDAGPGVWPPLRDRVFDRFVRGDQARQGGGRGLGLALAREDARLHGGDLVLQGDGRTFTARLAVPVDPDPGPGAAGASRSRCRGTAWLGEVLPLAFCLGVGLIYQLMATSGQLYLANDSELFNRPVWQWLPLLLVGGASLSVLAVAAQHVVGESRPLRRAVGTALGAAVLVGSALTLLLESPERPVRDAVITGTVIWVAWRAARAASSRARHAIAMLGR